MDAITNNPMSETEAIKARHSVRKFTAEPIDRAVVARLQEEVDACNAEGGLHIQLVTDDDQAFRGLIANYGWFSGVRDYLVLAGPDGPGLDEACGWYGERLVLLAQMLGLNSCWIGMQSLTRNTSYTLAPGERFALVIAIGKGKSQGRARKSKTRAQVTSAGEGAPAWFAEGIDAALLAPTAVNQQKFRIDMTDRVLPDGRRVVRAVVAEDGPYAEVDLGIVKYHFQVAAGTENFAWEGDA